MVHLHHSAFFSSPAERHYHSPGPKGTLILTTRAYPRTSGGGQSEETSLSPATALHCCITIALLSPCRRRDNNHIAPNRRLKRVHVVRILLKDYYHCPPTPFFYGDTAGLRENTTAGVAELQVGRSACVRACGCVLAVRSAKIRHAAAAAA